MKDLILILTTLILQSCADYSANAGSGTNLKDSTISNSTSQQNDSITREDWYLIEIGKTLPQLSDSRLILDSIKTINENVFSVLCTHSDGVSMTTYLYTFNQNKVKDRDIIVYGADQDLSFPANYEYKELRDSSDNKFLVVSYIQSVNDKSVLTKDGEFKTGFDFENVKIKTDSIVTVLSIMNDGIIKRDTLK